MATIEPSRLSRRFMYVIWTKILPATTCRGTRIKATANTGHKIVVPFDYKSPDPQADAAWILSQKTWPLAKRPRLHKIPCEKQGLFVFEPGA